MLIRYFSDLHLDFDLKRVKRPTLDKAWRPVALPRDLDTVLVLAGDIWNGKRLLSFAGRSWLGELAPRFRAVVFVLGNHDYWRQSLEGLSKSIRKEIEAQGLVNVHLLEIADGLGFGTVEIAGVRFAGGALWTDMDKRNPIVAKTFDFEVGFNGKRAWNDGNLIRVGNAFHKLTSAQWLRRHDATVKNLQKLVGDSTPTVLVTHHAPVLKSIEYRLPDVSSYLYGSDLSGLLAELQQVKLVIHGHTHEAQDYESAGVRVLCNLRGYAPDDFVVGFNENAEVGI